jgi:1-acyl-sn-glycerol-3-phosphate acyltransferase
MLEKNLLLQSIEYVLERLWVRMSEQDISKLLEAYNHLAKNGSLIVVFNHISVVDPVIVATLLHNYCSDKIQRMVLPTSQKFYDGRMGFVGPLYRTLAHKLNVALPPVIQSGDDRYSKQERSSVINSTLVVMAECVQAAGGVLALAPEGTRSRTASLLPAKGGIDRLFSESSVQEQCAILPIALVGAEKAFPVEPAWKINPFTRISVRVGELMSYEEARSGAQHFGFVNNLVSNMALVRVAQLLPPQYQGNYAQYVNGQIDE